MKCGDVQEALAVGAALPEEGRTHLLECAACATVAAVQCELDAILANVATATVVPDGFADRVMAALPDEAGSTLLWERRWFQVVLANAAGVISIFNLVRIVVRFVVPTTGWGGL